MDLKKDEAIDQHWQKTRTVEKDRTNFWKSFIIQIMTTIIPFLLLWIFFSQDFQTYQINQFLNLPIIREGYLFLILFGWVIITIGINIGLFYLNFQKSDGLIFTFAFASFCVAMILNGTWIDHVITSLILRIILRFLISFFTAIPFIWLGTLCSMFLKNHKYKFEEEEYKMLLAYRAGEVVPSKQKLRIEAKLAHEAKKAETRKELEIFKQELDNRIKKELDPKSEQE